MKKTLTLALAALLAAEFAPGAVARPWVCAPPVDAQGSKVEDTDRPQSLQSFWERRGYAFMWLDGEPAGGVDRGAPALSELGERHGCRLVAAARIRSTTKRVTKLLSPLTMKATIDITGVLVEVETGRTALRHEGQYVHSERVLLQGQGAAEKDAVASAMHDALTAAFGAYPPPMDTSLDGPVALPSLRGSGLFQVSSAGVSLTDGMPRIVVGLTPSAEMPDGAHVELRVPGVAGESVTDSGPLFGAPGSVSSPLLRSLACDELEVVLTVTESGPGSAVLDEVVQPIRSRVDSAVWEADPTLRHGSACIPPSGFAGPVGTRIYLGHDHQFTLDAPANWGHFDAWREAGADSASARGPVRFTPADLATLTPAGRQEAAMLMTTGDLPGFTVWRHDSTETMSCEALSDKGATEVEKRLRYLGSFAPGTEPLGGVSWRPTPVGGCEGGRFDARRLLPDGTIVEVLAFAATDGPVLYMLVLEGEDPLVGDVRTAFMDAVASFDLTGVVRRDPGMPTGR